MHASIASHSFGVRLLTRFVRLPIPSPQQIASLSGPATALSCLKCALLAVVSYSP